ncbi:MAG: DnaB-like helicase N-terminal domain-containing protein [Candidatus Vecturithrix sp.]|jgi:hypothetical protein|nr:DnaB-like helicase N-terminal domain-containing protein [Candidatus Vecturithrix sp.]
MDYQTLTKKSLENLPPHDLDAEQAVLGALILDLQMLPKVLAIVEPEDFYRNTHSIIFNLLCRLYMDYEQIDLHILRHEAEKIGFTDVAFLSSLCDEVPTAANVEYHAQIVRQKSKKRRLLIKCIETATRLYEDKQNFSEIYQHHTEDLHTLPYEPVHWVQTEHGQPKKIIERNYLTMLQELGFSGVMFNNALQFAQHTHHIVEEAQFYKNICFTLKHALKGQFEALYPTLWELLLKENKFDYKVMTGLNLIRQEQFLKDGKAHCHLYFQNGMVTVRPENVTFAPYAKLQKYVWKEAISPYSYYGRHQEDCCLDLQQEEKEERTAVFERFIRHISCQYIEGHFVDNKAVFEYGLAFLFWHYNDVLNQRSVVLIDNNPTDFSDGRRGKKIFMDAIRFTRSNGTADGAFIKEDGKAFGGTFKFQRVKPNTKVLVIDDVDNEQISFQQFYSAVTDGLVKEGKGLMRFAFTPETSPKIGFTTNKPFFSIDRSSMDRLILLPMTDFFSREGQKPVQVFGCRLFYDWDIQEWARFHDYIIRIIQHAMQTDPIQIPEPDLFVFNASRLLLELPESLVGFLDQLKNEEDYDRNIILKQLEEDYGIIFKKRGEFKHKLEMYARLRNRLLFKNTKDGRYKKNNIEYIRFEPALF